MFKQHNTLFGLFRKRNSKPVPHLVHYLRELNTELILEDRKCALLRFLKL